MNKCDKCNKEFQSKCHLNRHKNRKKPCDIKEIHDCELCELNFKYFYNSYNIYVDYTHFFIRRNCGATKLLLIK